MAGLLETRDLTDPSHDGWFDPADDGSLWQRVSYER